MRHILLALIFTTTASLAQSESEAELAADISAVEISSIKQGLSLRSEPIAASVIEQRHLEQEGIESMKDVSALVPNFYIPDYGSHITSSIYVRGLGARIDQPVVGMNVDNVPMLNKNSFDMDVIDIARMEILRGPQSSLYGRNTMGGVINIYTISPFNFEGVRAEAEYSSFESYKLRATLYDRLSDKVAIAIGGHYNYRGGGAFINEYNGEPCDTEQGGGARAKLDYRPSQRTYIENTLSFNTLEEGGYAYKQLATDEINYNSESSYKRTTISEGLSVQHKMEGYSISSITGYQYLDDKMTLDNDFTSASYFTLEQATREHSLTEDLLFKSERRGRYQWLYGAFGMYKHQSISAPVNFLETGIDSLVLKYPNQYFAPYSFEWGEDEMLLSSDFTNPTINLALYHKSSYEWDRLKATAAIRVDYERTKLNYHSSTETSYNIYNGDGELFRYAPIEIDLKGSPSQDFIVVLPTASLLYWLSEDKRSSIYGSVSKGYKAGGYNTQMFSDILQQELMGYFGINSSYDVEDVIAYDPEQSWNYEIGVKFISPDYSLSMDGTLFYIDTQDQQLTVFPEGQTTGRMMTNAGHSRSYGGEMAVNYRKGRFDIRGSYGYTNAKFIEYIDGVNDYSGNYVPYAPQHTIYAGATYRQPLGGKLLEALSFDVNSNGAGRIYWNEENSLSQPLYALLGCAVNIISPSFTLSLWGKNLTGSSYDTFYFESIGNEFVSPGQGASYGVKLSLKINKN